jgi:hypothetical protein
VDYDPVAVAHSEAILQGTANAVAIRADARRPAELVNHPVVRGVLDWDRPIGVLTIAVFHFMPDDTEVLNIIHVLHDAVPSGSYLALTHASADTLDQASAAQGEELYKRASAPLHFRSREGVLRLFQRFELIDPDLVSWRILSPADFCRSRTS